MPVRQRTANANYAFGLIGLARPNNQPPLNGNLWIAVLMVILWRHAFPILGDHFASASFAAKDARMRRCFSRLKQRIKGRIIGFR